MSGLLVAGTPSSWLDLILARVSEVRPYPHIAPHARTSLARGSSLSIQETLSHTGKRPTAPTHIHTQTLAQPASGDDFADLLTYYLPPSPSWPRGATHRS